MKNRIEIFVAGCGFCRETVNDFTIGKCLKCKMKVYDIRKKGKSVEKKIKEYGISAVPTVIINGKIKIVGKPKFNAMCSPQMYEFLEKNYRFR